MAIIKKFIHQGDKTEARRVDMKLSQFLRKKLEILYACSWFNFIIIFFKYLYIFKIESTQRTGWVTANLSMVLVWPE